MNRPLSKANGIAAALFQEVIKICRTQSASYKFINDKDKNATCIRQDVPEPEGSPAVLQKQGK